MNYEIDTLTEMIQRENNEITEINRRISELNEKKGKHELRVSSYELLVSEIRAQIEYTNGSQYISQPVVQ